MPVCILGAVVCGAQFSGGEKTDEGTALRYSRNISS